MVRRSQARAWLSRPRARGPGRRRLVYTSDARPTTCRPGRKWQCGPPRARTSGSLASWSSARTEQSLASRVRCSRKEADPSARRTVSPRRDLRPLQPKKREGDECTMSCISGLTNKLSWMHLAKHAADCGWKFLVIVQKVTPLTDVIIPSSPRYIEGPRVTGTYVTVVMCDVGSVEKNGAVPG